MPNLSLKCGEFSNGEKIPVRYTGEGSDISPPLAWSHIPEKTKSFVLTCEDPDAPQDEPFVHWLIYNISPTVTFIPEGIPNQPRIEIPARADQGLNSFGTIGYGGPMPPLNHGIHRYIFRLFALDAELGIQPGVDIDTLLKACEGHILAEARLFGTYERGIQPESQKSA